MFNHPCTRYQKGNGYALYVYAIAILKDILWRVVNVHTAKLPANVKSNTVQENREEHVNVIVPGCTISRVAVSTQ